MSDVLSEEAAREFLASVPQAHEFAVGHAHHLVVGDENDRCPDAVVEFPRGVRGGDR